MQLVHKGSQEIHLINKKIAQYISFLSFFTDRNPIYPSSFTHENALILTKLSSPSIFPWSQFTGLALRHLTQIWDRASQIEDPFNNNNCLEDTEKAMTFISMEHKMHMRSH